MLEARLNCVFMSDAESYFFVGGRLNFCVFGDATCLVPKGVSEKKHSFVPYIDSQVRSDMKQLFFLCLCSLHNDSLSPATRKELEL